MLLFDARVVEPVIQEEAVELRLGQLERARLLDRVLRGDDEEGDGEPETLVADGDLPLLHGFQHGALGLGRGAVDLVGQQQVGEHRAFAHAEIARPLIEDFRADHVGGEHVDGELDAGELEIDRLGHGVDQQRLGQSRHSLQHEVPAGEQGDQDALDDHVLADNDLGHAAADLVAEVVGLAVRLATTARTRPG